VAWRNDFIFNAEWIEFNHFWSLAISEQFYLVWPVVVLLFGLRALAFVCLTLIVAAFLLRGILVWHGDHVWTVYALTACRWDGLALGGLLALASRTPGWWAPLKRHARLCAITCLLFLIGLAAQGNSLEYDRPSVQVIGYSLLALFFSTQIVLAVNTPNAGMAGRVWSHSFLRFFGKYSYGLYVVHPTVMEHLFRLFPIESLEQWSGSLAFAALSFTLASLCVSVVLAWLLWHLYEKHFLKLKVLFKSTGKLPSGV
jgi:peptidoglycan/LPS O-acetylase OafA/YrhL